MAAIDSISPPRIFVVEDDALIRFSVSTFLNRNGFLVIGEAETGEEAIVGAKDLMPDLVVMDISLGEGMDGISAAEVIGLQMKIPVIFLTAMTERIFIDRAKRTGPFGYLTKPVDPKELVFSIEMALFRKKMEEKLTLSEEKYRLLVENMGEGLALLNADFQFLTANQSLCRTLGYSHSDIQYLSFFDLLPPQVDFFTPEKLMELALFHQRVELEFISGKGESLFMWVSPYLLPTEQGELLAFSAVDITERKSAENRIRTSQKLNELLHQVDYGILAGKLPREILKTTLRRVKRDVLPCDGVAFYFVDEKAGSLRCYEKALSFEDKGKDFDAVSFSEISVMLRVLRTGNCLSISDIQGLEGNQEYAFILNLGEKGSFLGIPVFSSNKLAGCLFLIANQIDHFTPEREEVARLVASEIGVLVTHSNLNQAFHNSRQLNSRILDLIPDALLMLDASGKVSFFKKPPSTAFPVPKTGQDFIWFLRKNWRPPAAQLRNLIDAATKVLANAESKTLEMLLTPTLGGDKIFVEIRLMQLFNHQLLAVIRDITKEKEADLKTRSIILHTQEEERKRFAGDLHDGLGQLLSALHMNLDALRGNKQIPEVVINRFYKNCISLTHDAIEEARRIAHNISPAILSKDGLEAAVRKMVAQTESSTSEINLIFICQQPIPRYHPDIESCLFRICQELIVNVFRHSSAKNAVLNLEIRDQILTLSMQDNGIGFILADAVNGLGIQNLKGRVNLLGGTLDIKTAPNSGAFFKISVSVELLVESPSLAVH